MVEMSAKEKGIFNSKKLKEHKDEIINLYNSGYSILELHEKFSIPMRRLKGFLIENNVSIRGNHNCHNKRSRKKAEETYLKKYGVKNISMLYEIKEKLKKFNNKEENKNKIQNKAKWSNYILGSPIHPLSKKDDFDSYKEKVWLLTKENIKGVIKPNKCFYTGIAFRDIHNDDLSLSIDHIKSISQCWADGISPEECSNINNICYTTRLFNSIKKDRPVNEQMIERFKEYESFINKKVNQ